MKQKFKIIGEILLITFLLCNLISCSIKESTIQTLGDSPTQPEYLSFFSPDTLSNSDIGKYWVEQFAKKYNKQVYINYDGASYYSSEGLSYRELLEKRMQSSLPDDLYIINAEDVMDFEKKGYWMDLSGIDCIENLSEAALYQSTYHEKIFSIPLLFTGFGFYWNVDMLKEHGLTVPENLEEFLFVCEKLKSEGILPYGANKGYALTVPAMCKGLSNLYGSTNQQQQISDLNSGKVPISTYMKDGFEFLVQMIDKGYLNPQQALNTIPGEDMEMFLAGECAFICTGLGSAIEQSKHGNFQVELTGLPLLSDGSIAVYGADLRLCVNPNSQHLDTALKFIEMVGTQEALDTSATLRHTMSSAKNSNIQIPSIGVKMYELLKQPGQIPNQDFSLYFNTWENIRNISREICEGMDTEEASKKLDKLQYEELEAHKNR